MEIKTHVINDILHYLADYMIMKECLLISYLIFLVYIYSQKFNKIQMTISVKPIPYSNVMI